MEHLSCPGLVAMGGDSCSKGCGFESWHRILDEHFSHIFVVKNNVCLKRPKINEKEARILYLDLRLLGIQHYIFIFEIASKPKHLFMYQLRSKFIVLALIYAFP